VRYGALTLNLAVRNTGAEALPFGFGFHPWIVRTQMTELQAPAYGVWLEDERHLPLGPAAAPIPAKWSFSSPVPLPPGFINNAFVGWDGAALVRWPDRHLQMAIRSSPALSIYILYSPSEASDFFCFEPVSHPVDAFNLTDPGSAGVVILAQEETADASTEFKVSALS
jgi:aldose 1-epimerase